MIAAGRLGRCRSDSRLLRQRCADAGPRFPQQPRLRQRMRRDDDQRRPCVDDLPMNPFPPLLAALRACLVARRVANVDQRVAVEELVDCRLERNRIRAIDGIVADEEGVATTACRFEHVGRTGIGGC